MPSNYVRDYERAATEEVDDAAQTPFMHALRQDLIFLGSTNVKFDEVGLPVKYRCQYFLESAGEVDAKVCWLLLLEGLENAMLIRTRN